MLVIVSENKWSVNWLLFYFHRLPLPPGNFSGLWNNEENFKKLYHAKYPVSI